MSSKTLAKPYLTGVGVVTGTYTGDGGATQAIAGVGFRPRFVVVYAQIDNLEQSLVYKADVDALSSMVWDCVSNRYTYWLDHIISLDADGFTVGDGTGTANILNILGRIYTYICYQ